MPNNPRIGPIEKATPKTWPEWTAFLENSGAKNLDHKTIAFKVMDELEGKIENAGWWAQAVTIAYEQEIGRRLPGQRSDGTFSASISKSTNVGMVALMGKWTKFAATDTQVLKMIQGEPRVSGTVNRHSWRAKAKDGTAVLVQSEPKKDSTAALVIQLEGHASPKLSADAKAQWTAILNRFFSAL